MTNLEALKAKVGRYPLTDNTFIVALVDRGLNQAETYAGTSKAFELATADVYSVLVSAANISEGGYQVSITDKSNLLQIASGIYQKWGVSNPLSKPNSIRAINPW